ncbi:unnamed protein product, partial [Mycena citricolor]
RVPNLTYGEHETVVDNLQSSILARDPHADLSAAPACLLYRVYLCT